MNSSLSCINVIVAHLFHVNIPWISYAGALKNTADLTHKQFPPIYCISEIKDIMMYELANPYHCHVWIWNVFCGYSSILDIVQMRQLWVLNSPWSEKWISSVYKILKIQCVRFWTNPSSQKILYTISASKSSLHKWNLCTDFMLWVYTMFILYLYYEYRWRFLWMILRA